jgi:DNA-directed RNA polymerase specialized sigma24 family protein
MIAPWKRKDTLSANQPATGADARLSAFNRQVLQQQEEAYTLAYYLLGSTDAAAQAVQTAVLQVYQQAGRNGSPRLTLLKTVLRNCLGQSPATIRAADPLTQGILSLPQDERRAVLLVDVLGLSYVEAAQVLSTSTGRVSQWLTGARLAMRAAPQAA